MGVTDQFTEANRLLQAELSYHLDPARSEEFRALLHRGGIRRLRDAIGVVKFRNVHGTAAQRHAAVMKAYRELIPEKRPGTKYRNAHYAHAKEVHREMDEQWRMRVDADE